MNTQESKKPVGMIVLFGSGEMSPVGRKIHEQVLLDAGLSNAPHIGILETPTGFEVNAIHAWPERMQKFFEIGLQNFHPQVDRIRAWRRDGTFSTNDPNIVDTIISCDYIYAGAGSPSYVIEHLRDSRALDLLIQAHKRGRVVCLGSASAIAAGKWALPVYEIYKAGKDPYWLEGLNIFAQYGLSLAIIPHWNNREGEDFDSTRCWMGKKRLHALLKLLPNETTVLGIDEQTACVLDFHTQTGRVLGQGSVHVIKNGKIQSINSEMELHIDLLR